jgi:hypothetical protein
MSEFNDSQLLMTFDATATRFFGELYEDTVSSYLDTQYLRLSDFRKELETTCHPIALSLDGYI